MSDVPPEVLGHGLHTCEHGTEVGTARCQDHPVSCYFNTSCHQLDITQYLFAETGGELVNYYKNLHAKGTKNSSQKSKTVTIMNVTDIHESASVCKANSRCSVTETHLLRSFISWKAFLMCVLLKVGILPFTVSSSASVEQLGCDIAGVATRLVRHERQCMEGRRVLVHKRFISTKKYDRRFNLSILLPRLSEYNYSLY